jgi:nicotinate-nucleotide adenylyltransferase
MCKRLSENYGSDPERAYLAGVLHDIRKESDIETQKAEVEAAARLASLTGEAPVGDEERHPKLLHAVAGAEFCKNQFGINDRELLSAIRFHTVGKADMTLLEKIVYVGDAVSNDRKYHDVKYYKDLAFENINKAVFEVVKFTILKTVKNSLKVSRYSFEAYNFYSEFK